VSPELYGLVNLVQNALLLLRAVFCTPALTAALRFYPEAEHGGYVVSFRRFLGRQLGRALVPMVLIAVGAGLVWALRARFSPWVVIIFAIFLIADVIRTFEMSLFNAARQQRAAALLGVVENVLRPALIAGAVLLIRATLEVVLAATAASIVIAIVLLYSSARRARSTDRTELPAQLPAELRRYALPLVPIALLTWTTSVSDRYIIETLSHDTASLGIYAAGYGLVSQPFLLLHAIVSLTLRPAYFSAVSRTDDKLAARTFTVWLGASAALCGAGVCAVWLCGDLLVAAFLGPQYRGAAAFVPFIACGYFLYVVEQVLEQRLLAYRRTSAVLITQASGALASVLVTIPLVMRFGTLGAAYACPVYFLLQAIVVAGLGLRRSAAPHGSLDRFQSSDR
jgi:O-antigen/teichoic acid export membrane protein